MKTWCKHIKWEQCNCFFCRINRVFSKKYSYENWRFKGSISGLNKWKSCPICQARRPKTLKQTKG